MLIALQALNFVNLTQQAEIIYTSDITDIYAGHFQIVQYLVQCYL